MKTSTASILEILGSSRALFSTEFAGEYKQPVDLLDTILENMEIPMQTVLGVIFLQQTSRDEYIIVDGLQRLVSISLLLYALCECYKRTSVKNDDARAKINKRYLMGEYGTKIQLLDYDKNIYEKIVTAERLTDTEKEHSLFQTLHQFWTKIKERNISASKLFKEISKIKVMVVVTEQSEIENRDLYQYLNMNKQSFDQIKLITSYLTENCLADIHIWNKTLKLFEDNYIVEVREKFLRDFLTIRSNGQTPPSGQIYLIFKKFFEQYSRFQNAETILNDVYNYAKFYVQMYQADFGHFEVQKQFTRINENNGKDTYPYLLEVMDDYDKGRISTDMLVDIVTTIANYICDRNSGYTLNDKDLDFAKLSELLNHMLFDDKAE